MRIASSEIQMQGSSAKSVKEKEIEKLTYWEGTNANKATNKTNINGGANGVGVDVDLSKDAEEILKKNNGKANGAANGKGNVENNGNNGKALGHDKNGKNSGVTFDELSGQKAEGTSKTGLNLKEQMILNKEQMQIRLIEEFMKALTGKTFKIQIPDMDGMKNAQSASGLGNAFFDALSGGGKQSAKLGEANANNNLNGWGISYERLYEREEHESMSFKATGLVKTADGKEISLKLEVSMSRSLYERSYTSFQAGDAALIDPLMVNYAGPAADLTEKKYSFDLDADGKEDQISFAGKGSGFLALDKNGDGKINDGNELFGTQSGDGFKDLAAYDEDGNGWIDENDSIFDKLRIWTKDAGGNDKLLALGQVGIGAIYLSSVQTQMDIVGGNGSKNGEVASTGMFLRENGLAGSIQHVNISI